jgi:hypothetical protein
MKRESARSKIKRELRRLFRSMDFVADLPASKKGKPNRQANQWAEIYQQLGLAWEFLALQCKHWEGYRKAVSGHQICRICGKAKDIDEFWLLLPRQAPKSIGRRILPTSSQVWPNRQAALLLSDTINFHGARLTVEVHNAHRSTLFGDRKVAVSADRMVRLEEGEIECACYQRLVRLRLRAREPTSDLPYSAFPWELPRKQLKNFPVCLEYDQENHFVGLTLLRPL